MLVSSAYVCGILWGKNIEENPNESVTDIEA
jgi:hypothetical protein